MGEMANPTPKDREATRKLASAIVDAITEDENWRAAIGTASDIDVIAQLAQEVTLCTDEKLGAEAEELRSGIERVMKEMPTTPSCDLVKAMLLTLLDDVDARDSLAHLEKKR